MQSEKITIISANRPEYERNLSSEQQAFWDSEFRTESARLADIQVDERSEKAAKWADAAYARRSGCAVIAQERFDQIRSECVELESQNRAWREEVKNLHVKLQEEVEASSGTQYLREELNSVLAKYNRERTWVKVLESRRLEIAKEVPYDLVIAPAIPTLDTICKLVEQHSGNHPWPLVIGLLRELGVDTEFLTQSEFWSTDEQEGISLRGIDPMDSDRRRALRNFLATMFHKGK